MVSDAYESLPRITRDMVQAWVGERSYGRGGAYYRDGRVGYPRRRGREIRAQCQGSVPTPYQVQVMLGQTGIWSARCTCPVGDDGHCKHVAATLLAWIEEPARFIPEPDLRTTLMALSHEELVGLAEMMIRRYPDLEGLLVRVYASDDTATEGVHPRGIRREVERVLRETAHAGGERARAARLDDILDGAHIRLRGGSVNDAATIYVTLATTIMANWETYPDEESVHVGVLDSCIEGLGRCLALATDVTDRRSWLGAVLDILLWDVLAGDHGVAGAAGDVLVKYADGQESEALAQRLWEALPDDTEWGAGFHRHRIGQLYLQLRGPDLDDEAYLSVCRGTGLRLEATARLLERNRDREAEAEAAQGRPWEILSLADLFVSKGRSDIARRLVQQQADMDPSSASLAWLQQEALARGDLFAAVDYAADVFEQAPSLESYRALRSLAEKADRWPALRPSILAVASRHNRVLHIQVHLVEGDGSEALRLVKESLDSAQGLPDHVVADVARDIEQDQPREALDLYMGLAHDLIAARGRGSYVTAARHLKRVRYLYRRLGEAETWQKVLDEIVQNNRRLRALREELRDAGLL